MKETKEFKPSIHNTKKENEVLKALQTDYEKSKAYNEAWHKKIERWTNEYMGRPYGNEKDGKSKIVTRDIKKHSEWLQASILDPFTSTPDIVKCNPANTDSLKLARNAEMILNQQFCRQFNRYNFLTRALKIMDVEGTVIVKTGWDFLEEEREVLRTQLVPIIDPMSGQPMVNPETQEPMVQEMKFKNKEKVRLIDKPTASVVRNQDIFIDPSCMGDFENMQFIIHQFETDLSTLKTDGRYKNVDKIKTRGDDSNFDTYENYNNLPDPKYFEFEDKPRRKILVREYWGNYDLNGDGIAEPIVCSWVDNVVIRLAENPYPDKKPPFVITPLLPIPFQMFGESNAELLGDIQKVNTAITRGIIDNMAQSNNAQIGFSKGVLDVVNEERMLNGDNFVMNTNVPKDAIWVGTFNQLPNTVFNVLELNNQSAQALTGVNVYGNNQTTDMIGENSASSRGVLDGGNLRKLMLVKNISENLIKPLMRKWLEYDAELLPPETIVRSTKSEDEFEIIHRDDLSGTMDIDITISTNEDNAAKARELAFLLQTIGPNEDPNVRKRIMSDIMRLHKMYDSAKWIEEYQPQPDPLQQEMMMAQIENLKAQTQEILASAGRQQVDGSLKEAKISVEQAKAQSIGKDINMKGLEFYQKQNRFDQMQNAALKEKEIDEKSKNERLKLQLEQLNKVLDIERQKAANGQPSIYSPITADNRGEGLTNYSPSAEPNTARRNYNKTE
jgi:hypothetical protein